MNKDKERRRWKRKHNKVKFEVKFTGAMAARTEMTFPRSEVIHFKSDKLYL